MAMEDIEKKAGPARARLSLFPFTSYPATSLMRLIISSTAFSTGHLSVTTRFMAFAHTFSLLRMVNFQFLVNSKVTVPAENWSCTTLRCGSSVQNLLEAPDFVTGYQRPSAPST